jgi:hypothetical protein
MAAQVRDRQRYATPDSDAITQTLSADGASGTADACHLSWDGLRRPAAAGLPLEPDRIRTDVLLRHMLDNLRIASHDAAT